MSLTNTPSANRLHIAILGRRNSGKSSLINAITGQVIAVVSDYAGTTTDPVYKAMEIHPLGPCMLIDTAGYDDTGELGKMRVERTKAALQKTDIALMLFSEIDSMDIEKKWIESLRAKKTPIIPVISKADVITPQHLAELKKIIGELLDRPPVIVSSPDREGIPELLKALDDARPDDFEKTTITGTLVKEDDVVLLVMPQDIQAPKGRLILPQVQTIRDLLDNKCVVISCTADKIDQALRSLKNPPELIITDSQVFPLVWEKKPKESRLTSFSVLMAAYKGDIHELVEGANAIDKLNNNSRILIAEACTHAPLEEDIGRVKIPARLRAKYGQDIQVDIVAGHDYPDNLTDYDLIIHCGACMFNRKHVLSRIEKAKEAGVPITNYGVALAKLTGILDKVDY